MIIHGFCCHLNTLDVQFFVAKTERARTSVDSAHVPVKAMIKSNENATIKSRSEEKEKRKLFLGKERYRSSAKYVKSNGLISIPVFRLTTND